jgi:hypothetical protein
VQSDASQGERTATKDSYIRVLSKGMMHGTHIVDKLLIYGDAAGTGASASFNDLYEATDSVIYLNTKIAAVQHQAKIWLPTADANLRIIVPATKSLLIGLGDDAGATYFQVKDTADALRFQVDSDGNTFAEGYVKGGGGFRSSDNSAGESATITIGANTITVKNGLITAHT